ncbi:MAG: hypothetical protein RH917_18825 [Lacipirellulaceae bacterium]
MQINIPPLAEQQLAQHATAAGYSDVTVYVTEHVLALAEQPTSQEHPPLSEQQLQASLASCDLSMAQFEQGLGLTTEEARERTKNLLRQQEP